jgi:hypothetical protein
MLHLFNEVFIEHKDQLWIPTGSRIIVVSSDPAGELETNVNCLNHVATVSDLIGEGRTMQDFVNDTIDLSGKIVIYADPDAFAAILASWLKSTTNMDADAYENWMNIYKFTCITNAKDVPALFTALQDAWASATAFDYSGKDFIPSYEFLLASAFADIDFSKKAKLKSLLSKFIKREYENVILEIRRHIDQIILDKDIQTLLGASSYTTDISLDNIRTTFPQLDKFKSTFYNDTTSGPTSVAYRPGTFTVDSKIDLSRASSAELTALCSFIDSTLLEMTKSSHSELSGLTAAQVGKIWESRGWTYAESIRTGEITDDQYVAAVNEIVAQSHGLIHVPFDLRESILTTGISYLRTLKVDSNTGELQKYTLR